MVCNRFLFFIFRQSIQQAETASSRCWRWWKWLEGRSCRWPRTGIWKKVSFILTYPNDLLPCRLVLFSQTWGRRSQWWTQGCNWRQRSYKWASRYPGRRCKKHGVHFVEPEGEQNIKTRTNKYFLTELNIAVRVRSVVIPIPTLPGTDSAGMKRDSQARIWREGWWWLYYSEW